jgi:hypothetical protein
MKNAVQISSGAIIYVEVEVEVNLRTDSQSANLSWCQAPMWDP